MASRFSGFIDPNRIEKLRYLEQEGLLKWLGFFSVCPICGVNSEHYLLQIEKNLYVDGFYCDLCGFDSFFEEKIVQSLEVESVVETSFNN